MGRRSGLEGFIRATVRAAAAAEREKKRAERHHIAEARRFEREIKREDAQRFREQKVAEKLAKTLYLEERQDEVSDLNSDLNDTIFAISTLLEHTLEFEDSINFSVLKKELKFDDFKIPDHLLPESEPKLRVVNAPSPWKIIFPWVKKKYQRELKSEEENFIKRKVEHFQKSLIQKTELDILLVDYETRRVSYFEGIKNQHDEIDKFETDYLNSDPNSILDYCEMVLTRSEYPETGFPQSFRLVYLPENKELVIEYYLPEISIIPTEIEYKYIKTRDAITSKVRKPSEIKNIYQNIIASITLRSLHELFEG